MFNVKKQYVNDILFVVPTVNRTLCTR
jgi:hypothetical protein